MVFDAFFVVGAHQLLLSMKVTLLQKSTLRFIFLRHHVFLDLRCSLPKNNFRRGLRHFTPLLASTFRTVLSLTKIFASKRLPLYHIRGFLTRLGGPRHLACYPDQRFFLPFCQRFPPPSALLFPKTFFDGSHNTRFGRGCPLFWFVISSHPLHQILRPQHKILALPFLSLKFQPQLLHRRYFGICHVPSHGAVL